MTQDPEERAAYPIVFPYPTSWPACGCQFINNGFRHWGSRTKSLTLPPVQAQPTGAVHEYLTRDEALREVFPDAAHHITDSLRFSSDELARAERALRRGGLEPALDVTLCYDAAGAFTGYAVVSDEIGKYRPITYMVAISSRFEVVNVAIMVYRKDRGSEVRTPRFLYQYRGKTAKDPIRTGRDIINISGATLSVRAVNAGVKKALYLVSEHYGSDPPAPTYQEARARRSNRPDG